MKTGFSSIENKSNIFLVFLSIFYRRDPKILNAHILSARVKIHVSILDRGRIHAQSALYHLFLFLVIYQILNKNK